MGGVTGRPRVFPFPLLVADIGGTNARFALVEAPGAPLGAVQRRAVADFPGLAEAVLSLDLPARPRALVACGAGPVSGRSLALTNAPWRLDGPDLADALGLAQGLLLNDFEALALSLPALPEGATRAIGESLAGDSAGPRLLIGAGTGLGVAALIAVEGRWRALPSEAGHMDIAPGDADEAPVWAAMERVAGRVTAESVLAGPGLSRLHDARERAAGRPAPGLTPAQLTARADAAPQGAEAETLRAAWRILGRYAGDLAIAFLASGGVVVAGGVPPKIAAFLDAAAFRAGFEAKAPVAAAARAAPTSLLLREDAVLLGMAALAALPQNYALDYAARLWRQAA
ncbi:MAG: glucokinase [Rhizobiales bacterium]|nr:glucokinase [Hyphomicrobiales bacterium]